MNFLDFRTCCVLESSVELGEERTELSNWLELTVKNEWSPDLGGMGLNMNELSFISLLDQTDSIESESLEVSSNISSIVSSVLVEAVKESLS